MRSVFLFLAMVLAPAIQASDKYYDFARVIAAQPITVSERIPVRKQVCTRAASVSPPGNARQQNPQATIGELVRIDTRQRRPDCRNVTEYQLKEKQIGWRVTYQYRGTEYVRQMKEKPGQRIRVRVDSDTD